MSPETVDGYRTAAHTLHGFWDWYLLQFDTWGPVIVLAVQFSAFITAWCLIGATCHGIGRLRERRELRRTPAAADNLPPVDDELLITCRRIDRQPLADPDDTRRAINYLRDQQRKEKP